MKAIGCLASALLTWVVGSGASCGGRGTLPPGQGTAVEEAGADSAGSVDRIGSAGSSALPAPGGAPSPPRPAPEEAATPGNGFAGAGCLGGDTACSNCLDDDGDGLVDAFDPECTGPLDDDEATFATGIPGDNVDFCQDCFFDGNSGHGDDGCQYATACLTGEAPRARGASGCFSCEVTDRCRNSCLELTPNGCDCFGCCAVRAPSGETHNVRLSDTCTAQSADIPEKCEACVPSVDCFNDCGPCEICIGKTTLDPGCDEGPVLRCLHQALCDEETPCPEGQYCLTGCCIPSVIPR